MDSDDFFGRLYSDYQRQRSTRDHDRAHQPAVATVGTDGETPTDEKAPERTIGGETVDVGDSQTTQHVSNDSWLVNSEYGVPRGRDAYEARQLGQTQTMEVVKNVVTSQLTGAELAFESDTDLEGPLAELASIFRELLGGPHLMGDDWDDLVATAVSDMIDLGEAYFEVIPSEDGALPMATLKPVDPLTIQRNVDETGTPQEPAYYQANFQTGSGHALSMSSIDPTPLDADQLVWVRWPHSRRSNRVYPISPAMQVKRALEHINDATTHLGRYYSDNEVPKGILQLVEGNDDAVQTLKEKLEQAAGNPRTIPVVGGPNDAKWVDVGGDQVDLDVLEETKYFSQIVWGAIGINKHEIGLVSDVNRSTAQEQTTVVYKRVTKPLTETFENAINRQILPLFDAYNALDATLRFKLKHNDPVRERKRESQLIERWQAGTITYDEFKRRLGEEPGETTISIAGEDVDFGSLPKHIASAALRAVQSGDSVELVEQSAGDEATRKLSEPASSLGDDARVEWMAEPDACEECRALDGTTMSLQEFYQEHPPHPHCRCSYQGI